MISGNQNRLKKRRRKITQKIFPVAIFPNGRLGLTNLNKCQV